MSNRSSCCWVSSQNSKLFNIPPSLPLNAIGGYSSLQCAGFGLVLFCFCVSHLLSSCHKKQGEKFTVSYRRHMFAKWLTFITAQGVKYKGREGETEGKRNKNNLSPRHYSLQHEGDKSEVPLNTQSRQSKAEQSGLTVRGRLVACNRCYLLINNACLPGVSCCCSTPS